jgi:GTP cyclohydrolase-4
MQDNKPQVQEDLERVGVTNLRTIVLTEWKGRKYTFTPKIELTIDLDKKRRGAHMSRLVESITETIGEEIVLRHGSLEDVGKSILLRLEKKHPYQKAQVSLETDLVIPKKTPKTGKNTMESYGVFVEVSHTGGIYRKTLRVNVLGNTVCPHAMQQTGGKTHIQRAEAMLELETAYDKIIDLEDMVDCVEKAFPSEIYSLLKTEDEIYVVEKMHSNPKFVEDVTRTIIDAARKRFPGCRIRVKTISQESIHRHDVIAESSTEN